MTEKPFTFDDFVERLGSPLLKAHFAEIKRGGVTPERIRQMAREAVPIPEIDGERGNENG